MHAILGYCNDQGLIELSEPRAWVEQILSQYETAPACLSALEIILGAAPARDLFAKVTSAIGQDLFLPWLRGDSGEESQCLVEAMQLHNPVLASEGEQFMVHNAISIDTLSNCKQRILDLCRDIFQVRYKDKLIEPIALRLGAIPGDFFRSAFFEDVTGRRLVVGTRVEFPSDAPERKFEALFDQRACFDSLRWSFMVMADPLSQVSAFRQCLHDQIEVLCEEDASVVESASPLCDELLNYARCTVVSALPPDFTNRVWKCYRMALLSSSYWLSCDELLLLCTLAKIPVAIFTARLSQLNLVASFLPEGAEPVLLKLDDNGHGRQRTHFERVLPHRIFLQLCPQEANPRIHSQDACHVEWKNLQNAFREISSSQLEQWLRGFFTSFCCENTLIDATDVADLIECLQTQDSVTSLVQHLQNTKGKSSSPQTLLSPARTELLLQYLIEMHKSVGSEDRPAPQGSVGESMLRPPNATGKRSDTSRFTFFKFPSEAPPRRVVSDPRAGLFPQMWSTGSPDKFLSAQLRPASSAQPAQLCQLSSAQLSQLSSAMSAQRYDT